MFGRIVLHSQRDHYVLGIAVGGNRNPRSGDDYIEAPHEEGEDRSVLLHHS